MGAHRQRFAYALVCGLPAVAGVFVGLRLVARWKKRIRLGWDDWLLVVALILSFAFIAPSVMSIEMINMGYHVWEIAYTADELTNPDFKRQYAVLLSQNLLSIPILPLAKASIIIILLKVSKVITPIRRLLQVTFMFNAAACIVPMVVWIFVCPPATGNTSSERTFGNLRCLGRDAQGELLLFVNCANLLTDLLVFPIPFFIMRELLNTNLRSKILIVSTFASSLCVTALSALKIYVTYRDRLLLIDTGDWTYSIEFCITHGEANVGIIVACIPVLRSLISARTGQTTRITGDRPGYYAPGYSGNYYVSAHGGAQETMAKQNTKRSTTHLDDEELLESSDILLTTVVEAKMSPRNHQAHDLDLEHGGHNSTHDSDRRVRNGSGSDSTSELILKHDKQSQHNMHTYHSSIPKLPLVHTRER
ncbi:hypothetical protein AJ80_01778 [Polytolypa hystricis UAMH7299]|uniref:Rhodopsin domain-containing protein n=1 Tax=Polytolypa hystricis (strain UAMH7299) TaxID=1447883 RepID=A0A2B7YYR9_POLH7|nr:hypothetical protein AJ80_01778 [Polytolypa hystricis UAMH7299]